MEVFLAVQCLLILFSVLLNSIHFLSWIGMQKKCKPVKLLKTLQSGVLLLMTVTVFPLEVHALNNAQAKQTAIAGNY